MMLNQVLNDHGVNSNSKVRWHYSQLECTRPPSNYLFMGTLQGPAVKVDDTRILAGPQLIQYNKYDSESYSVKWQLTNYEAIIDSIVLGDYCYIISRNSSYSIDLRKVELSTGVEIKSYEIGSTNSNSVGDYGSYYTSIANDKYGYIYVTKGRYGGTVKLNQDLEPLFEIERVQTGFQDDYLTVYDEYIVRVFHYSIETAIYNLEGIELSRKNLGANYGYSEVIFDESLDSFYILNSRKMAKWSFNEGIIGDRIWLCSSTYDFRSPIFIDNFKETMLARESGSTYNTFGEADKTTGEYLRLFSYSYERNIYSYGDGYITSKDIETRSFTIDHPFYIED